LFEVLDTEQITRVGMVILEDFRAERLAIHDAVAPAIQWRFDIFGS
jgi:hypothetical protein